MKNKRIFLHICCAPCLIYPLEKLTRDDYEAAGFFYNPNISPQEEYDKRRQTLEIYAVKKKLAIIFLEAEKEVFTGAVAFKQEKPQRCHICWYLRLKKTAQEAKKRNFSLFSTTLLVSPYQDTLKIKEIGEEVAKEAGVEFYFYDFRQGYKKAVLVSKEEKMYRQKYCGCSFSLEEREKDESVLLAG